MAVELGRVVVVELGRLAEVVVLLVVDGLLVVVVAPVLPEVPGVGRTLLLVGLVVLLLTVGRLPLMLPL